VNADGKRGRDKQPFVGVDAVHAAVRIAKALNWNLDLCAVRRWNVWPSLCNRLTSGFYICKVARRVSWRGIPFAGKGILGNAQWPLRL